MQSPLDETQSPPIEPREAIPYATDGTQFATLAEVTAVVIRICAVITFFQFVTWLAYIISMFNRRASLRDILPAICTPLAQMILGVVLWFFSNPISLHFAPPRALPMIGRDGTIERLERLAFSIAGVVLLVYMIPDLITWLAMYFGAMETDSRFYSEAPYAVLGKLAQALIAMGMIVGNARLRTFWRKLRSPTLTASK